MAYTTINNPESFFTTSLWVGNGQSTQTITNSAYGGDFQPDLVWGKQRTEDSRNHWLNNAVGGFGQRLELTTGEEEQQNAAYPSINSNGFTVGQGDIINQSGKDFVSWQWKAGGTTPSITYNVKVVSDSGNKYRFDDFGASAQTIDLQEGGTFTFDQSDNSNSGHPLRFSTTSNGTHGGGSEYTTGVTTNGIPGQAGAYTRITVAASAPTLYYYCTQHSGMGGQANTNSLFASSNFKGSIKSAGSFGPTQGFSIVSYTGSGSNATIGHGLNTAPDFLTIKRRTSNGYSWYTYHMGLSSAVKTLYFNNNDTEADNATAYNSTAPTSTVFNVGTNAGTNASGVNYMAYVWSSVKGYSKYNKYEGNGNVDGPFVYTGFKPAYVFIKKASGAVNNWGFWDNQRDPRNEAFHMMLQTSDAERDQEGGNTHASDIDILSNGFKIKDTGNQLNTDGERYIYGAIADKPLVATNNVAATAR